MVIDALTQLVSECHDNTTTLYPVLIFLSLIIDNEMHIIYTYNHLRSIP